MPGIARSKAMLGVVQWSLDDLFPKSPVAEIASRRQLPNPVFPLRETADAVILLYDRRLAGGTNRTCRIFLLKGLLRRADDLVCA